MSKTEAPKAAHPGDARVWARGRRTLTTGLVLAVTLVAFESLAVTTILPDITHQLGDLFLYGWAISGFMLSSLIGIVLAGSLADRIGMVVPMAAGIVLFAVGLSIGGVAPTMPILIAGRVLQGVGAGVVPAISWAAVARAYPEAARPRMVAVVSTAWVVPALVGPAVASFIGSTIGWRWVFLGLIVPVLAAGAVAVLALRIVRKPDRPDSGSLRIVPVLGVVVGTAIALAALEAKSLLIIIPGSVAGAVILAFTLRRLTPPGTLTARAGVPATVLTRGLSTASYYAVHAFVPYAVVTVRGGSSIEAAIAISTSTIAWTCSAWLQARLIRSWGPRRMVRIGEILLAIGILGMLAALMPQVPLWLSIIAWTVGGFGMGLAYSPLAVTTMDAAHDGEEGRAMSALQLLDLLGQAVGIGAAGAAIAAFPTVAGVTPPTGTMIAFVIGLVIAVIALLVVHRLPAAVPSTNSNVQGGATHIHVPHRKSGPASGPNTVSAAGS